VYCHLTLTRFTDSNLLNAASIFCTQLWQVMPSTGNTMTLLSADMVAGLSWNNLRTFPVTDGCTITKTAILARSRIFHHRVSLSKQNSVKLCQSFSNRDTYFMYISKIKTHSSAAVHTDIGKQ